MKKWMAALLILGLVAGLLSGCAFLGLDQEEEEDPQAYVREAYEAYVEAGNTRNLTYEAFQELHVQANQHQMGVDEYLVMQEAGLDFVSYFPLNGQVMDSDLDFEGYVAAIVRLAEDNHVTPQEFLETLIDINLENDDGPRAHEVLADMIEALDTGVVVEDLTEPPEGEATFTLHTKALDKYFKEQGFEFLETTEAPDGKTVTYRMEQAEYERLLLNLEQVLEGQIAYITDRSEAVQELRCNRDYTRLTFVMDPEKEKDEALLIGASILPFIAYYDMRNLPEDVKLVIETMDASTGQIYKSDVYPDMLNK